jgi:hypothetical protein
MIVQVPKVSGRSERSVNPAERAIPTRSSGVWKVATDFGRYRYAPERSPESSVAVHGIRWRV